jgi:predicted TPR repeat methyltransferase
MSHLSTGAAYDQIAERWLDDRFSQVDGVPQHQRALAFLTATGGWALNVGCGCNTRFNRLLQEHGLKCEGLDVSARMIELAQLADPEVVLHTGDICDWTPVRQYRFISAWDSLWHVPLESQRAVMIKLISALEAGGVFLFSAGGLDAPGEHRDNYMGPTVYYASLGIKGLLAVIDEARGICRHLEFDQWPQQHLYLIVQKMC